MYVTLARPLSGAAARVRERAARMQQGGVGAEVAAQDCAAGGRGRSAPTPAVTICARARPPQV